MDSILCSLQKIVKVRRRAEEDKPTEEESKKDTKRGTSPIKQAKNSESPRK